LKAWPRQIPGPRPRSAACWWLNSPGSWPAPGNCTGCCFAETFGADVIKWNPRPGIGHPARLVPAAGDGVATLLAINRNQGGRSWLGT